MTHYTATQARANFYNIMTEASESHAPIHISSKRGNAVLISEEDWAAIQETLYLQSIPGMSESIREGLALPVDKCKKDLDW